MSPSTPLRVCVVVGYDLAEEGGVKRHAIHVADALRRLGDSVTVIGPMNRKVLRRQRAERRALGPAPAAGAGEALEIRGFGGVLNVRGNGSDNRLGLFSSPLALRRFMRDGAFDVVHVHEPLLPALPYWAVWSSGPAARVCTFHSYVEREGLLMRAFHRAAGAVLFPSFQRAIAVSEPAAEHARVAWKRPLALIPNGVPTARFRTEIRPRGAGEPLRILFVGHFRDRRKGLPHLLDACRRLAERGVPYSLDVVGNGGPGPLPEAPAGVTFHGAVSDEAVLAEHYRRCDVFAATATGQESFGIVLLEAMAAGKAIVCSDIAGYRQVVTDDGARFVPPADADALAVALAELAADPASSARMAQVNLTRAQLFDWDTLAVRVREQYQLAIADRQRGKQPATEQEASAAESAARM